MFANVYRNERCVLATRLQLVVTVMQQRCATPRPGNQLAVTYDHYDLCVLLLTRTDCRIIYPQ